jgi:hypothetical protein
LGFNELADDPHFLLFNDEAWSVKEETEPLPTPGFENHSSGITWNTTISLPIGEKYVRAVDANGNPNIP